MYGKAEAGILLVSLALIVAAAAAPATPALIAEVQTALDRGDAQHAVNLADEALREKDISPSERGRLQLYHGLAEELLGATDAATRDFTAALNGGALPPEDRTQALLQRGFLHDGQQIGILTFELVRQGYTDLLRVEVQRHLAARADGRRNRG